MPFILKKSSLDPTIFEVLENDLVVAEICVRFSLKKFSQVFESLDEIHQWLAEIERKIAKQSAYGSLTLRSHSSQQLMRKLERKGFSDLVCQEVIEHLQDCGLLQDEEFTQSFIRKELRSGHGPRYVEAKLRSLGMPTLEVRKIITVEKQLEAIEKLARKKSKNQMAALLRRGFDFECINKVLSSYNS